MTLEREKVSQSMHDVVLKLMDEGGLANVRARSIAKEVGISVGTIYNFFGSLEGLIESVCSDILRQFSDYCRMRFNEDTGRLQLEFGDMLGGECHEAKRLMLRFLHFAEIYMDFVSEYEQRWNAMLAFNRTRAKGASSEQYLREKTDLFEFIGAELSDTWLGESDDTRYHAARALWSGMHGIVLLSYLGQVSEVSRKNTWRQITMLVRYFVRGLFQDKPHAV